MRYSAAPARRDALLRRLEESGYVSSSGAAASLGVSEMTIRRDLSQLAAEGRVRRVVGGASLVAGPDGGTDGSGRPFEERRAEATLEKVEGRRLIFTVSVSDGRGLIAAGKVTRVVVDVERFLDKASD